jgi:hypothetical protein
MCQAPGKASGLTLAWLAQTFPALHAGMERRVYTMQHVACVTLLARRCRLADASTA